MSDLIDEYADYDSFVCEWQADTLRIRDVTLAEAREQNLLDEQDTRHLWRLLGLLDETRVFVQLPEWLVEEKAVDAHRSVPTTFVGCISHETEAAILFEESVPARRLMHPAEKIHSIEHGIENTPVDSDRRTRLNDQLQAAYQKFEIQDTVPYLSDEWLPKSQLVAILRRTD